jgi:hypothetical protein
MAEVLRYFTAQARRLCHHELMQRRHLAELLSKMFFFVAS